MWTRQCVLPAKVPPLNLSINFPFFAFRGSPQRPIFREIDWKTFGTSSWCFRRGLRCWQQNIVHQGFHLRRSRTRWDINCFCSWFSFLLYHFSPRSSCHKDEIEILPYSPCDLLDLNWEMCKLISSDYWVGGQVMSYFNSCISK